MKEISIRRGQVVFITGPSSGIGRETAYRFAQEGSRLVLTYNRGKRRGEEAERRCRKLGAENTLLIHLDVTDDRSIRDVLKMVRRKYGGVDFLIKTPGPAYFSLSKTRV